MTLHVVQLPQRFGLQVNNDVLLASYEQMKIKCTMHSPANNTITSNSITAVISKQYTYSYSELLTDCFGGR